MLGEINKWISVSEARFGMIDSLDNKEMMTVVVYGVADEEISIGFVQSSGEMITVNCIFTRNDSSEETLVMTVTSTGSCYL